MTTSRLSIPQPGQGGRAGPYDVPPHDGEPRLYALLAVEVKPGHIVYYHLELDHEPGACTIDMERDEEPIRAFDPLEPTRFYGPWHINATISGTVVSDRPDYRPPTRADSSVGGRVLAEQSQPIALPGGEPR